jgi:hypothetical protein
MAYTLEEDQEDHKMDREFQGSREEILFYSKPESRIKIERPKFTRFEDAEKDLQRQKLKNGRRTTSLIKK